MTLRPDPRRGPALLLLSSLGGLLLFCTAASAELGGVYTSELGVIRISEKAGVVTGTLVSPSACGQKKGARVLEGTLFEDSITGDIRACQHGPKCKGDTEGLVMLLVTRNGRALSGAAHFDTKCKTALQTDALSFRRQKSGSRAPGDTKTGAHDDEPAAKPTGRTARQGTAGKTSPEGASAASKKPKGKDKSASGTGAGRKETNGKVRGGEGRTAKDKHAKDKHAKDKHAKDKHAKDKHAKDKHAKAAASSESDDLPSHGPVYHPVSQKKQRLAVGLAQEAALLLKQGKAEEARTKFEESVATDPNYSQGYNGIGITYYMRDRYDEAKEQYQLALEANPANHDVYYNLACIHALTNEKEQAIGYLQISLLNGYIDLQTLANDADLKNLAGDERFEALKKGEVK